MKRVLKFTMLPALCVLAIAANPEPEIPYFKQVREVAIAATDRQNYLIVDSAIWSHARPDLADLRLYDGTSQVPYQITSEKAASIAQEAGARILNLVQNGDHTEFDLDISPATEYNRIRLAVDRKDFLVTASVAGRDSLTEGTSTPWPTPSTLFDFSRENLGSNATVALPLWTFRYVHVRLSPGIFPKEIKQATVANLQERKAFWTDAGACRMNGEQKRTTVFTCEVPSATPIDRIQFSVPASRVNFRRSVTVANEKGNQISAGNISRIRMNRGGTTAISEDLELNIFGEYTGGLTVTIDNGDDPPLAIDHVQPQSVQRRFYFEPQGKSALKLYYGDDRLAAPVYDYAKFFRPDPNAAQALLSTEAVNAAFTDRPDERPWSERHKSVLWGAMLVAVAVLGFLALRGLKSGDGDHAPENHAGV